MVVCIACFRNFSLRGYSQHVRRTSNHACRRAYHEAEVAAELEADVPEDYFGPYHENDLQWPPDGAGANGNGCDGNAANDDSEEHQARDCDDNHHDSDADIDDESSTSTSEDDDQPGNDNDNDDSGGGDLDGDGDPELESDCSDDEDIGKLSTAVLDHQTNRSR